MDGNKPIIGFRVEVVVEPDGDGFHAYCPALKGLHTCGNTEEEALRNARDAALAYLQSLIKHGDPIPVGVIVSKESEAHPAAHAKHAVRHAEELRVVCTI